MPTDIEEYLNKVCSHIYNKSIKEQTKEEMRCHIEEKIELLQLQGIKEADAIQQVISEMGDADSLSKMMSGVHHEVCFIDLKNAMHKLLIGFIIISIIDSILVFSKSAGYFISILLIPGVFLFFAGLFQLRNCNKYLRVSYASYVIYTLLKLIQIGAKALPLYYEYSYFILYSVVSITFTIVLWFLGYGLKSLIKDHVDTKDFRYCISRSSYFFLITIPFVILVQNINDYDFKMIIMFFVAMFYIYIIF